MSKLYYKNPLIAAYMDKEFGVKHCWHSNGDGVCEGTYDIVSEFFESDHCFDDDFINREVHIHPDSYHVFEPKVGDLVTGDEDDGALLVVNGYDSSRIYEHTASVRHIKKSWKSCDMVIIQRDNKPFFMPERV